MATVQEALTAISTKIATDLSATRMASDYLVDRESIAAGSTKFQIRKVAGPFEGGSNQNLAVLAMNVLIHHRLADPDNEQSYGDGALLTNMTTLLTLAFWTDLAEVFDFSEDGRPDMALDDVTREGDVVSFALSVKVQVQP